MIELYNDEFDEEVVRKYLEIKKGLGNNLIKVEGDRVNKNIVVYVYRKIELDKVKVLSVEDLINETLSSFSSISFKVENNNVLIKVETLRPEICEEISVALYEIEKKLNIKLNVIYTT